MSEQQRAQIRLRLVRAAEESAAAQAQVANAAHKVANAHAKVANASRHGKYADKDKRRAYMRDLMRAKRAAAKAAP